MGWIAGPIILLMFAAVTLYCSWLLADAYRHPRDTGRRTYTYPEAVSIILGEHCCSAVTQLHCARRLRTHSTLYIDTACA